MTAITKFHFPLAGLIIALCVSTIPVTLGATGPVVSWGDDEYGQVALPSGLSNVVQVAAGAGHSLALYRDGQVAIWGKIYDGVSMVPAPLPAGLTNIVAISAGFFHSLALRVDNTVVGWGYNDYGAASGGAGLSNVVAISANGDQSLALRADGTVVAWGRADPCVTGVPGWLTNVTAISAGQVHNLALRQDGTVVGWGANDWGQATGTPTPADGNNPYGTATGVVSRAGQVLSNVVAVAAGGNHSLVLQADGTVLVWGLYDNGSETDTPAVGPAGLSNIVAIAAGFDHDLALTRQGTVVAWGYNAQGQAAVPTGLTNVSAIAAGNLHSLAVGKLAVPPVTVQNLQLFPGLTLTGAVHQSFTIEWTDDVAQPSGWRTLTNLVLPSSPFLFFDTTAPGQSKRFYRVSGPGF